MARTFAATSQASLITDSQQRILHASKSFTAITGYHEAELIGLNCRVLQGPGSDPLVTAAIRRALSCGEPYEGDILNYRKNGSPFWNSLSIRPLRDETGKITHFVSVQRDVTARMAYQEGLRFQSSHDPVTGLPNRSALSEHLSTRTARQGAALALVDVVALRTINSTFGYEAGDILLRQLARRMRASLADGDFLACLGGDRFAVVLENIDGKTQLEDALARLHEAGEKPFPFPNHDQICTIDLSAGLARILSDGTTGFLLHRADAALREARANRPAGPWWSLAPDDPRGVMEWDIDRGGTAGDLTAGRYYRDLLFTGGLSMFMQPVLDLGTGGLSRVEALARLTLTDGTVIPPARFLPSLDEADLDELFQLGVNTALSWLARWDEEGLSTDVSVNISPSTLRHPECVRWVDEALRRHGIEPNRLGLEVLESQIIESDAQTEAIDRLVSLGVGLFLDDLGSGFSTLQRLFALPFDTIKLDRGLLVDLRTMPVETLSNISALVQMGRDFGVGVVIEGLEDFGMAEAARILGVPLGQGYFFARPMPAGDVPGWAAGFTFPLRANVLGSALGALAYHWQFMRWASPHPHVVADCPLADFISLHSTSPAVARWHAHQHGQASDRVYGQMLSDWLIDIVRDELPN